MKITSDTRSSVQNRSDASATETSQTFEEATFSTLDAICRSSEETYDAFMKGFVYLRPENVQTLPVEDEGPPTGFLEFQARLKKKNGQASNVLAGASNFLPEIEEFAVSDPQGQLKLTQTADSDNVIEEEILGSGTTTKSYLMRSDHTSKSLKVKVGNFVDEEEDAEDAYCPSFTAEQENSSSEVNEDQETMPENVEKDQTKLKTVDTATSHSFESTKKQSTSSTSVGQNLEIQSKISERNDSEMALSLAKSEIYVDPSLSEVKKTFPAHSTEADDLLDLVGDYNSEDDDPELVYDPSKDRPNFGEVEDEVLTEGNAAENVKEMTKETLLEFKVVKSSSRNMDGDEAEGTTRNDGDDNNDNEHIDSSNQQTSDNCNEDTVEAFVLDTEFDYDNVTLTPKYSAEEMAILMNAASAAKSDAKT